MTAFRVHSATGALNYLKVNYFGGAWQKIVRTEAYRKAVGLSKLVKCILLYRLTFFEASAGTFNLRDCRSQAQFLNFPFLDLMSLHDSLIPTI